MSLYDLSRRLHTLARQIESDAALLRDAAGKRNRQGLCRQSAKVLGMAGRLATLADDLRAECEAMEREDAKSDVEALAEDVPPVCTYAACRRPAGHRGQCAPTLLPGDAGALTVSFGANGGLL